MVLANQRDINPYDSPAEAALAELPVLPMGHWNEVQVHCAACIKGATERRLLIDGSLQAEIYYSGFPWERFEHVAVNGKIRGRPGFWVSTILAPRIDFSIEGWDHLVPAWIEAEARLSWRTIFCLSRFRLTIAGRVVYEEQA